MRLWQKVFLCTLTFVLFAVNFSSTLLMSNNHRLLVEREKQNAITRHEYIISAINSSIAFTRLENNQIFLDESQVYRIINDIFLNQSDTQGLSIYKGETRIKQTQAITSKIEINLIRNLTENDNYLIEIVDQADKTYMLVCSKINLERNQYNFISSFDITPIFTLINEQIRFTQFLSIVLAIILSFFLLIVVLLLLRPLRIINQSTREIANGHYNIRLKVKGNNELSELSRNMNTMTDAIEQYISSLERTAESRKIFIGNLAHEMKTPLTSILGFADILRVKRNVDENERSEYAGIIVEEAKHLRSLSGKLMELIRLGNSQLDLEELDIYDLMSEVETVLTPILKNNNLKLNTEFIHSKINGDKELLKSLLYNLVDNAVKASSPNQSIDIICYKNEENQIVIKIRDYGIGIAQEEINKITEPFYMVDKTRTKKAGGAGLGLALCMEIVQLHNAKLKIESELNKGTSVYIIFENNNI